MCRIAGWWQPKSKNIAPRGERLRRLEQMRDSLQHGGPDGAGAFVGEGEDIALGHRRLSILELSELGAQPMQLANRWWITFNGEIYNFREIQAKLQAEKGIVSAGNSDTETLLLAIEAWGVVETAKLCRGMFAFVLWDYRERCLYLVRDRLGVKPLYLYEKEGLFLWASELKALCTQERFERRVSAEAVRQFLRLGYVPPAYCIYENTEKVPAGQVLRIDSEGQRTLTPYWSAFEVYSQAPTLPQNAGERQELLESTLMESLRLRMVADVEVGAFLSGGVDSSLVVAALQTSLGQPLRTFTIGVQDEQYNEAQHARRIAEHLGTQHTELYCGEADFAQLLPLLPFVYDEPFGDSSAIPTLLVSQLAAQSVKVSLSADGGDELFGGYTKYEAALSFQRRLSRMPRPLRKLGGFLLSLFSPQWLERNARFLPLLRRYKNLGNKLPKLQRALGAHDAIDFFRLSSTYLTEAQLHKLMPSLAQPAPDFLPADWTKLENIAPDRLLGFLGGSDIVSYLEGDIMTKVDRATMRHALEGREPLLDHELLALALALKDSEKIGKQTKMPLRNMLYKLLPAEMIERPKQGFAIPVEGWLRTRLRSDLENLCEDKTFFERIPLAQNAVRQLVSEFLQKPKTEQSPQLIWFIYTLWQWQGVWIV